MTESELLYNQPHLEEGHSDPGDVTHLLLRYPSRGLPLPKMPLGSLLLCRTRGLAEDVFLLGRAGPLLLGNFSGMEEKRNISSL